MRDFKLNIDKKEVLRYLGYRGQQIDTELNDKIDSIITRAMSFCAPGMLYRIFDISVSEDGIRLLGTDVVFKGESIKKHLAGACRCAVMAVTLGMETERQLHIMELISITDALIYNAVCTALIESAADECEKMIAAEVSGMKLNYRYSPGYGDFPLSQQREISKLLDMDKKLGITLTDSYLMIPRKSVTAVIGLFDMPAEKTHLSCDTCSILDDCSLLRKGFNCENR